MNKKPENPYAFPLVTGTPSDPWGMLNDGMTLRDYFAAKALIALLMSESVSNEKVPWTTTPEINQVWYAETAYQFADAMLTERKKP